MLNDKVAIVTGGAAGIGEAIVRQLVMDGAKVVIADFDADRAHSLADNVGRDAARAFHVDVTNADAVRNAVVFTVAEFGALHLAVNNAGVGVPTTPIVDLRVEDWRRVIDIDLTSVFYSLKYEIPAIIAAGGGAIVNMSSVLGVAGVAGSAAYVAAKHGVVGLTKSAALEYAAHGIRVNAVGPGYVATAMIEKEMTEAERAEVVGLHPLGRIGKPGEIAALTSFLLSEKASFITGAYYPADGGYLAQ